jgi:hypothetical protein
LQLIEAKKALFQGDVDLILVDDIYRTGESDLGDFRKFGEPLGPHLKEFYEVEYGRKQEEYGVVVLKKNGQEILDEINRIIALPATKELLHELTLKWRV